MRTRTILAVTMLLAAALPARAELLAGIAKVDITPPAGGLMYGYGARGTKVSQGVHDPLYAKALVLDDGRTKIAIVTLDLGSFPAENTANVRRMVWRMIDIEHVFLVASHSHSTPRFSNDFPSAEDPWLRRAEKQIANAVRDAGRNTVPARIGVGWGRVEEGHNRRKVLADGSVFMLWRNRERVPTAPLDYSLAVARVEALDGTTLASLVNFACHPVVLGPENLLISADYVGVLTREVEEALGGQCMFLQGAAGDINPFWDKTAPEDGAYRQTEIMGKAVAAEVLRVTNTISDYGGDPSLSVKTESIPLASRTDIARENRSIMAEINTVLVGDALAFATFPGEFFLEHGLRLKRESKIENTMFVGYANGALGYFPTIKATTEGGYGAASATRVEVGAGERLVNRALVNLYYQKGMISP